MTELLSLHAGALRCDLWPALGGAVAGLWYRDQVVLKPPSDGAPSSGRDGASYPLVPYSNRIGDGQLQWAGSHYSLTPAFAPEPHTIHGVGWAHAWQVLAADASAATLVYQHGADAGWPFDFLATQTFQVTDSALEMTLSVRNDSAQPAPVGLGWHPYFAKDATTRIGFAASGRWEMDARMLPTQRRAHSGLNTDCSALQVDHCFDGWDGRVQIQMGSLAIGIESDLQQLVVFTTPNRDTLAVEPVSHINNAHALALHQGVAPESLGLRVVAPGQTTTARMRIVVQERT